MGYEVRLIKFGAQKVKVIKKVCELTGWGSRKQKTLSMLHLMRYLRLEAKMRLCGWRPNKCFKNFRFLFLHRRFTEDEEIHLICDTYIRSNNNVEREERICVTMVLVKRQWLISEIQSQAS